MNIVNAEAREQTEIKETIPLDNFDFNMPYVPTYTYAGWPWMLRLAKTS